jgi:hypothetical protein
MMRKLGIVVALGLLLVAGIIGWQVGSCELANYELQDDLHDMASQLGMRMGLDAPHSDEELVNSIISKAQKYDIELRPEQVTVRRRGSGENMVIYLAAEYTATIYFPGIYFTMHFHPASGKGSV